MSSKVLNNCQMSTNPSARQRRAWQNTWRPHIYPPAPALAKAGAAPGTTAGVALSTVTQACRVAAKHSAFYGVQGCRLPALQTRQNSPKLPKPIARPFGSVHEPVKPRPSARPLGSVHKGAVSAKPFLPSLWAASTSQSSHSILPILA